MKTTQWFLIFLLFLLAIVCSLFCTETPEHATGQQHPVYKSMVKSGPQIADSALGKWLSFAFGATIICLFTTTLVIGSRRRQPNPIQRRWLLAGGIFYLLVFSAMCLAYWQYNDGQTTIYFGGLPAPTAWMVYGMWFCPLFFSILYIARFHQWILSPEEEEAFRKIIEKSANHSPKN